MGVRSGWPGRTSSGYRRRVTDDPLAVWCSGGPAPDRAVLRAAVKESLAALAAAAPGHSVEVRVPPYGAVQCVPGPRHRRDTPPNVVETDVTTWLGLVSGRLTWEHAVASGALVASGSRAASIGEYLPLC